eukprot:CAMPEP_0176411064 /NCGR_PEP_ID=MMETSP0127-20121128/3401_1 /TAXON_ID=938130 /ORGANISM="Platyophrya macrostoma, Strain WH" /LENGTH=241 /DNA_ID=CAMNT_0017790623 /DNA_START=19 /DNA_END=744 /DNA_ORIENTATION=+
MTWRFPRELPDSVRTRRTRAQEGGPQQHAMITRSRAPPTNRKPRSGASSSPAPDRPADDSGSSGTVSCSSSTKPTPSDTELHTPHTQMAEPLSPEAEMPYKSEALSSVEPEPPASSPVPITKPLQPSSSVTVSGGNRKRMRELLESCPERVAKETGRRCLEYAKDVISTSSASHMPSLSTPAVSASDVLSEAELKTFYMFATTAGGRCRRDCPELFSHLTKRVSDLRTKSPTPSTAAPSME